MESLQVNNSSKSLYTYIGIGSVVLIAIVVVVVITVKKSKDNEQKALSSLKNYKQVLNTNFENLNKTKCMTTLSEKIFNNSKDDLNKVNSIAKEYDNHEEIGPLLNQYYNTYTNYKNLFDSLPSCTLYCPQGDSSTGNCVCPENYPFPIKVGNVVYCSDKDCSKIPYTSFKSLSSDPSENTCSCSSGYRFDSRYGPNCYSSNVVVYSTSSQNVSIPANTKSINIIVVGGGGGGGCGGPWIYNGGDSGEGGGGGGGGGAGEVIRKRYDLDPSFQYSMTFNIGTGGSGQVDGKDTVFKLINSYLPSGTPSGTPQGTPSGTPQGTPSGTPSGTTPPPFVVDTVISSGGKKGLQGNRQNTIRSGEGGLGGLGGGNGEIGKGKNGETNTQNSKNGMNGGNGGIYDPNIEAGVGGNGGNGLKWRGWGWQSWAGPTVPGREREYVHTYNPSCPNIKNYDDPENGPFTGPTPGKNGAVIVYFNSS